MSGQACDTSGLLPALASWHPDHDRARTALAEVTVLPAPALLECYSVLTRMPAPHRVMGAAAAASLTALRRDTAVLPAARHLDVLVDLAQRRINGGAVYDGLVAATAKHHDLHLITRDRRARPTYDAVGVSYTLL